MRSVELPGRGGHLERNPSSRISSSSLRSFAMSMPARCASRYRILFRTQHGRLGGLWHCPKRQRAGKPIPWARLIRQPARSGIRSVSPAGTTTQPWSPICASRGTARQTEGVCQRRELLRLTLDTLEADYRVRAFGMSSPAVACSVHVFAGEDDGSIAADPHRGVAPGEQVLRFSLDCEVHWRALLRHSSRASGRVLAAVVRRSGASIFWSRACSSLHCLIPYLHVQVTAAA